MKNCPNCGELIGDNVSECFKCHYNYSYGRVITHQEIRERREEEDRRRENESQLAELLERGKEIQIKKNPFYEYGVEVIEDLDTGELDKKSMQSIMNLYSSNGWRLHTVFTNELGRNATSIVVASLNATICQTVLIFERCIKEKEI